jgi:hypothetical protein
MTSTKNTTFPKPKNTPKSSTFSPGFERGSQGKELRRVHAYIPNKIPKRGALNPPQENRQKRLRKSPKRGNGRDNKRPRRTTLIHLYIP